MSAATAVCLAKASDLGLTPEAMFAELTKLTADLVAADREYDAAIDALRELNRRIAEGGWIEVEHGTLHAAATRVIKATHQRRAALDALSEV